MGPILYRSNCALALVGFGGSAPDGAGSALHNAAPEQLLRGACGTAVDMWACGASPMLQ